ncbi:MAG: biopolymer transporter ExbD [Prevotellaceae bacterium]|jgi:biopolymer transport protein ExbD|nr:biopolymer transporter ExbD [Prevotellaceae bacterium]
MSKVKAKKHSPFIDMTAMSDVTVLLLTFFMSTATFLPKEPIRVTAPASVMEIKIPDANLLTILVKPDGLVYLNLDRPNDKLAVLDLISKSYSNLTFTDQQRAAFLNQPSIGVPIKNLPEFLDKLPVDQDDFLKGSGVPTDSLNNELADWVKFATQVNPDLKIAIKADQDTPYPKVSNIINTLQDLKQNRFNLITTLRGMPEGY